MSYAVRPTAWFLKELKRLAKRYASIYDDVAQLGAELAVNPLMGKDLGGGVRKVRMAITSKHKGKSGGARVITLLVIGGAEQSTVLLLSIYDKSERSTLTDSEIRDIKKRSGLA